MVTRLRREVGRKCRLADDTLNCCQVVNMFIAVNMCREKALIEDRFKSGAKHSLHETNDQRGTHVRSISETRRPHFERLEKNNIPSSCCACTVFLVPTGVSFKFSSAGKVEFCFGVQLRIEKKGKTKQLACQVSIFHKKCSRNFHATTFR